MARTILLFHIISARPSKQPLRVRTFLKTCIYGAWLLNFVSARTNKRHHHLLRYCEINTPKFSLNRFLGPVDDYVTTKPPVTNHKVTKSCPACIVGQPPASPINSSICAAAVHLFRALRPLGPLLRGGKPPLPLRGGYQPLRRLSAAAPRSP